jgi:hypothetical protein
VRDVASAGTGKCPDNAQSHGHAKRCVVKPRPFGEEERPQEEREGETAAQRLVDGVGQKPTERRILTTSSTIRATHAICLPTGRSVYRHRLHRSPRA